jgi:hypothetical protein
MSMEDMNVNAGNIADGQGNEDGQSNGQNNNDNDLLNPGAGSLGDPLSQSASTQLKVQVYSAMLFGTILACLL